MKLFSVLLDSDGEIQCNRSVWFSAVVQDSKLCPLHSNSITMVGALKEGIFLLHSSCFEIPGAD